MAITVLRSSHNGDNNSNNGENASNLLEAEHENIDIVAVVNPIAIHIEEKKND